MNKEQASVLLYWILVDLAKDITPDVEYSIQRHFDSLSSVSTDKEIAVKCIARGIWKGYSFPHDYYDDEVPDWAKREIEETISIYFDTFKIQKCITCSDTFHKIHS